MRKWWQEILNIIDLDGMNKALHQGGVVLVICAGNSMGKKVYILNDQLVMHIFL